VARVARDPFVGRFDGLALAFEHLGKIMIGGEQRSGHLGLDVVAARREQDIGDLSALGRIVGQQRGTDIGKPDEAHGPPGLRGLAATDNAAGGSLGG
jgi:hypothetical protein